MLMQGFCHHVQLFVATVSIHNVSNIHLSVFQCFMKAIRPTLCCLYGVPRELASANH